MRFYKTSSAGNDFIVVAAAELKKHALLPAAVVADWCREHWSIGADGVVFYTPRRHGADFSIFNRDGLEAEISGNGMAGLAAVLFSQKKRISRLILQTKIGARVITRLGQTGNEFSLLVEIGVPDFQNRQFFPFLQPEQFQYQCNAITFYPVSVGNPHIVVLVGAAAFGSQLLESGQKLESDTMFPAKTNVEFCTLTAPGQCRALYYERGVGHTLASSTGSAAIFAVLRQLGHVSDALLIDTGHATVRVVGSDSIAIENRTRLVYRGESND